MLLTKSKPVLLQILYYMPKHPLLIQEFIWGYDDLVPDLVKTHKFLMFWQHNIDAAIAEIYISVANGKSKNYKNVKDIFQM